MGDGRRNGGLLAPLAVEEYADGLGRLFQRGGGNVARPIVALIVSFLVICVLGCAFIFTYWMRFNPSLGLVRCGVFVVIMGGVHLVGYRLWKRHPATMPEQAVGYASIWDAYAGPIKVAVVQQVILSLFASLLLDGGQMLALCMFGVGGAWAYNIIIMARRPTTPTPTDILIVKYGFWLAALVTLILAPIMGRTF